MPITPEQLLKKLETLDIPYKSHNHPPLHTVEQSQQFRGQISGGHCKNLFLKDKKGALWLIIALEEAQINLKTLHAKIGSARLSFGKPELMLEILGVTPGSVTPFSLINDTDRRVTVILDENMMAQDMLNYHPLTNEQTITITAKDLLNFISSCGHTPRTLDLS